MKKRMQNSEVVKRINAHLLSLLPIEAEHEFEEIPALSLLRGERFDVMSKYIYAKLKTLNAAEEWRNKVYHDLQKIFGFKEGDGSGKNSLDDYLRIFDEILVSVQQNGLKEKISAVPAGRDNVIIDGAHRLAASLLFRRTVPIIKFNWDSAVYDYRYFLQRGLDPDVADAMALEFCRLSPQVVIAAVFPVARGKDAKIQSILKEYGQIVYEKQVIFSEIGRHNLVRQLYRGEAWVGADGEITAGLRHHVQNRFVNDEPVKFYFLAYRDAAEMKQAKARIRDLFDLKNDSIHINDTHEETTRIAEQLLAPNSLHFLNHAQPWLSKNFLSMFREFQREIQIHQTDKETLCVDSGSVLAAYGLRDTDDLDYLHFGAPLNTQPAQNINSHSSELVYHPAPLADLVFDPRNYFYYDGIKFLSLQAVRKMKEKRNESKDIRDILLIDSLRGDAPSLSRAVRRARFFFKKLYERIMHFEIWMAKRLIPASWIPFARRVYHARFYLGQAFGPVERTIPYKGFVLYYSKGTSLIFNIYKGETYEPELTWKILETLKHIDQPVFLDIGANIGLITLNVLAAFPQARVFAFEPGPHQHDFFQKTISGNHFENRVSLYKEALSREAGEAYFSVHNTKDVSGDGFFDTGRAGKTEKIKVAVNTLDDWWASVGKPHIDVVKMDAEGAELWILMGAGDFLKSCRPVIFLEINEENLQAYPYQMEDIVHYFQSYEYELKTIAGTPVQSDNIREVEENTNDFMAFYRQG